MTRALAIGFFTLAAVGMFPSAALSDGLPVTGIDAGPAGLVGPAGEGRLLALPAGPGTVIAEANVGGGSIRRSFFVGEKLTIPTVALDGSATGLTRDGRMLVLIRPRRTFPQRATRFALVETRRLRLTRFITLPGDFSFDALSPDGATLYLIQYTSRRDFTRYRVRAFDVASRKLLPEPIIDPREPDERMAGWPITRAYSANGRWAYTLYAGTEGTPFVHALDTVAREARCIDLDELASMRSDRLYALRFSVGPEAVRIVGEGGTAATISTSTHALVSEAAATATPAPAAPAEKQSSLPWPGVAGLALLGGLALAVRRSRALRE
jgi:hypothetical protein